MEQRQYLSHVIQAVKDVFSGLFWLDFRLGFMFLRRLWTKIAKPVSNTWHQPPFPHTQHPLSYSQPLKGASFVLANDVDISYLKTRAGGYIFSPQHSHVKRVSTVSLRKRGANSVKVALIYPHPFTLYSKPTLLSRHFYWPVKGSGKEKTISATLQHKHQHRHEQMQPGRANLRGMAASCGEGRRRRRRKRRRGRGN